MFLGSYTPSFNINSRRIALPKKIREYLATSKIILSYGFETCIFGFDTEAWKKESAKNILTPLSQRSARNIRRFFFSAAKLIEFDNQGRFVIPSGLLEYAQIKKPIIIGAGDHFEIWDQTIWEKEFKSLSKADR